MTNMIVQFERDGPLGIITMNRDAKLNAINAAMIDGLLEALDLAETDPQVRVILLRGAGRSFSAGFDLTESFKGTPGVDPTEEEIARDFDFIMRFWDARKPVVAGVQGACLGGAFELMLACDLCVATQTSRFGEPEVTFGSGIVAMLLPWFCGPRRSAELLLRGEQALEASRAMDWGLVNRVVPESELENATRALAMDIAHNDRNAVQHARRAMKDGYDKAGFREAMAEGVRHCISVERDPSAETLEFYKCLEEQGLAAALAWRDAQMATFKTEK